MNRNLFFTLIKLYIIFFVLRAIAQYTTYPLGLPVSLGWIVAFGLFFYWLFRRFQRYERTRQPSVQIQMGESEALTAEEMRGNATSERRRSEPADVPILHDGVVSVRGERIETDSMKWIVWIKDQETIELQVENSDPAYSYHLRKRSGTQEWVAFTKPAPNSNQPRREVEAGLSEALFQRKLDEIGDSFSSNQNLAMAS